MMVSFAFSFCCLIFMTFILLFYFSKNRISNIENRLYSLLLIANVLGLIIDVTGYVFLKIYPPESLINVLISHLYLLYYFSWGFILTLYVYSISFPNASINNKLKHRNKFYTLYAIIALLILLLPLNIQIANNSAYSEGIGVNLVYALSGLFIVFDLYCITKNFKRILFKKYSPIFVLLIMSGLAMTIQKYNPELTLLLTCHSIVTFIMYFTIENPDVQMISELYKNKKIIEKTNEDNSKFMFRLTGDIKKPVKDIIDVTNQNLENKTKEELIQTIKYINNNITGLDYIINKVLNINAMDTAKIKTFENKYNVRNLFKSITAKAKDDLNEKIKFEYSISNNIPSYLYGDAINLKQAIMDLIENSKRDTEEGEITLEVSAVVKYNICRLIINVEDTGKGIEIEKVNQLLSMNNDNLNKEYENIIKVKNTINSLGGNLMIKSEVGKGTTIIITLDQKIYENEETELSKKLETYEQTLYGNKRILLIDDDTEEIDYITEKLEKQEANVSYSLYERDCIEKIKAKLKYDLIILDDTLGTSSALNVLNELKQIKGFKTPVVVMIDDNKEKIKLHYLKDGFQDCISKSKLDSELERIMKRF